MALAPAPVLLARVVDFETIGFDPPIDAVGICEVGYCDLMADPDGTHLQVGDPSSILCNPGCPIPPTASAIHHIVDADVADEPPAASILREVFTNADVPKVAHNARYERLFYRGPECEGAHRWVCTWKCAHRVWPHAPGFSNQALRYWKVGTKAPRRRIGGK